MCDSSYRWQSIFGSKQTYCTRHNRVSMAYVIALVLSATVSIQARTFNNPILSDKPYYEPGAIKVNGTYYVVATLLSDITNGVLPIHTSTDLVEWKLAGYVFDGSNTPTWADNTTIYSPEIHQVGANFVVYFSAFSTTSSYRYIGVATAPYPLGPYSASDRPIGAMPTSDSNYPSLINDEEKLYLVWTNDSSSILTRELNVDGLNFSSDQTTTLLKPSLAWEGGYVDSPFYHQRGSYHYLLYSVDNCNGVGVARSSNALGPYEKLFDRIIVGNSNYSCPTEPSVVKDLDGENDVIFFNVRVTGPWFVVLASLSWDDDDWPIVGEY